jgi:hypothetical protein
LSWAAKVRHAAAVNVSVPPSRLVVSERLLAPALALPQPLQLLAEEHEQRIRDAFHLGSLHCST